MAALPECSECAEFAAALGRRGLPVIRVTRADDVMPLLTRAKPERLEVRFCLRCGGNVATMVKSSVDAVP